MIWPPPQATLHGPIVRLEPLEERHRGPLAEISGEPQIWAWMDRRIAEDRAAFDAWFDERLAASQDATEWCYVTHRESDDTVIGSSSYLAVRPVHDGLEIGWTWLHPSAWRSGANRGAKYIMLGFAFQELGCMRVEFKTDSRNERSRAALAKLGAEFEGVFRNHMYVPGAGRRDSAYYSITDTDWPAIRDRLQAGLPEEVA